MKKRSERNSTIEGNLLSIQNLSFSMGMSSDYKLAIEEGSNIVRIGSLIFGERAPANS